VAEEVFEVKCVHDIVALTTCDDEIRRVDGSVLKSMQLPTIR